MKLHFEPDLGFQLDAIQAAVDVFEGQPRSPSPGAPAPPVRALRDKPSGPEFYHIGNHLQLGAEALLANLRRVQRRHGLPLTDRIDLDDLNLSIEMETGTGKTYVYLRTIHALHQAYGFHKFLIVVPSLAIKEGVAKSIQVMREHLGALYDRPPLNAFIYDSGRLGLLRGFAYSSNIEILIATVQALHQTPQRLFHQPSERLGGASPVELIQGVRPIVIVDEPQSVDGGEEGAGREALRAMRPLFTLRYSATHRTSYPMIYRLGAFEAHEQGLVKGIEVASARIEGAQDLPYVRLLEVCRRGKSRLFARIEVDGVDGAAGVARQVRTVHPDEDLEQRTQRAVYRGLRIGELVRDGRDRRIKLLLPDGSRWLREGEAHGAPPVAALHRQMIRRTIRQHLDRETELRHRGIKVLSLFFIDSVRQYRSYDAGGNPKKGPLAEIFEEEYLAAIRDAPCAEWYPDTGDAAAEQAHGGYFSIDAKRRWVDTTERNQAGREAAAAAYTLIMRDKERLLSFDTPLRFIFSHSALREGWDNPNVFQICSLREMGSEPQRRQSIGRGLRLCVDQHGRRVRDPKINRLTVIATESVARFAAGLQKELEQENGSFAVPTRKIPIADADRPAPLESPVGPFDDPALQALWERTQERAVCRIAFDPEALILRCTEAMRAPTFAPAPAQLRWTRGALRLGPEGVRDEAAPPDQEATPMAPLDLALPDLLTELERATGLTRRTLATLLTESGQLHRFRASPQAFIQATSELIRRTLRSILDPGLKYEPLGDSDRYALSLLTAEELKTSAHLATPAHGLIIPTPLGPFHPKWAARVEGDGEERLYLFAQPPWRPVEPG